MIVVDVTVLGYFLVEGTQTQSIIRLRDRDPVWTAPSLWRAGLMNVLWKYLRNGTLDMDLALEHMHFALQILSDTTFEVRPDEVLPLAAASGCTAYDCHYIALAERMSIPLATHDKRLIRAFPERAFLPDDI